LKIELAGARPIEVCPTCEQKLVPAIRTFFFKPRSQAGLCRVCGHRAIEPYPVRVTVRLPLGYLVAIALLLIYILIDVAQDGRLDGSLARLVWEAVQR
jgi:hypothetical protein